VTQFGIGKSLQGEEPLAPSVGAEAAKNLKSFIEGADSFQLQGAEDRVAIQELFEDIRDSVHGVECTEGDVFCLF
jgi:hypothetical protein